MNILTFCAFRWEICTYFVFKVYYLNKKPIKIKFKGILFDEMSGWSIFIKGKFFYWIYLLIDRVFLFL